MDPGKRANRRLGKRIRQIRLEIGWSQEELAYEADIATVYLSGIERGVRNPTVASLVRITEAMEVTLSELFENV
mgnify:CR=1|tara:strand:- start:9743 stop:9964 length:222 start_codon:yes stop_codon:yes gene_type:complete